MRGEAGALVALHRPLDVLCAAEACVAVTDKRNRDRPADVLPLIDQLAVRDQSGIGHAEARRRHGKPAHEAELESGFLIRRADIASWQPGITRIPGRARRERRRSAGVTGSNLNADGCPSRGCSRRDRRCSWRSKLPPYGARKLIPKAVRPLFSTPRKMALNPAHSGTRTAGMWFAKLRLRILQLWLQEGHET